MSNDEEFRSRERNKPEAARGAKGEEARGRPGGGGQGCTARATRSQREVSQKGKKGKKGAPQKKGRRGERKKRPTSKAALRARVFDALRTMVLIGGFQCVPFYRSRRGARPALFNFFLYSKR